MTTLETLEVEVKAVYPKAIISRKGNGAWCVENNGSQISGWASTPRQAWASAWGGLSA